MKYRTLATKEETDKDGVLWIRHYKLIEQANESPENRYIALYVCGQCQRTFIKEEKDYPKINISCDYPDCYKNINFLKRLFRRIKRESIQGIAELVQVEKDVWV